MSNDSGLNQIDPSTNIISLPDAKQDTEPNSKYHLEEYFIIAQSKHHHFI